MRIWILTLALAAPLAAQVGPPPHPMTAAPPPAAPAPRAAGPKITITRQTLKPLEDDLNLKLSTFNPAEPVYMLGLTRGVYLQGYGAVFSVELDLIQSPTVNPFHGAISKQDVVNTHTRKLKQLGLLQDAVRRQMIACAKGLDAMPPDQQLVMVVRLDYQPWEDTDKLPAQILLSADRKSAEAGNIQVDDQFPQRAGTSTAAAVRTQAER